MIFQLQVFKGDLNMSQIHTELNDYYEHNGYVHFRRFLVAANNMVRVKCY